MTRVDWRDPESNYHKMDVAELRALTPQLFLGDVFPRHRLPGASRRSMSGSRNFSARWTRPGLVPLADWKIYLRWHLIHPRRRRFPSKFVDENFDFYGRSSRRQGNSAALAPLRGIRPTAAGRSARAVLRATQAFPPEAKAAALAMVKNLMAALRDDLPTLDWMSPATRQQASEKLDAIELKIGYPDKWRDYSAYQVDRGPYIENVRRGRQFEFARDTGKNRQAGRPHRVGHDAADRERLLQSVR